MLVVLNILVLLFQYFAVPTKETEHNSTLIIHNGIEHPFDIGDEIAAVNSYGNVVGVIVWEGKNTAMTIWGVGQFDPLEVGYSYDEPMVFRWYDVSREEEFDIVFSYNNRQPYLRTINTYLPHSIFLVDKVSVLDSGTSTDNETVDEFYVGNSYPNPFERRLTLPIGMATPGYVVVNIYDIVGKLVFNNEYSLSPGKTNVDIYISNLPSGKYIVNVIYEDRVKRFTAIKVR